MTRTSFWFWIAISAALVFIGAYVMTTGMQQIGSRWETVPVVTVVRR